ncbi:hypothetical protein N9Y92_01030 [Chlamydiales bacterium]|nr:hypothetical protein [Chlamydiales bacterium]
MVNTLQNLSYDIVLKNPDLFFNDPYSEALPQGITRQLFNDWSSSSNPEFFNTLASGRISSIFKYKIDELNFSSQQYIDTETITRIIKQKEGETLRVIYLSWLKNINLGEIFHTIKQYSNGLEEIHLSVTSINTRLFNKMAMHFPNVKLLDVSACEHITDGIGPKLQTLTELTHLNLNLSPLTEAINPSITALPKLSHLSRSI